MFLGGIHLHSHSRSSFPSSSRILRYTKALALLRKEDTDADREAVMATEAHQEELEKTEKSGSEKQDAPSGEKTSESAKLSQPAQRRKRYQAESAQRKRDRAILHSNRAAGQANLGDFDGSLRDAEIAISIDAKFTKVFRPRGHRSVRGFGGPYRIKQ